MTHVNSPRHHEKIHVSPAVATSNRGPDLAPRPDATTTTPTPTVTSAERIHEEAATDAPHLKSVEGVVTEVEETKHAEVVVLTTVPRPRPFASSLAWWD
jgi:hypothetical protein